MTASRALLYAIKIAILVAAAIWLAEGRIQPGVYPPEIALDPEPFCEELERLEIFTRVTVSHML